MQFSSWVDVQGSGPDDHAIETFSSQISYCL